MRLYFISAAVVVFLSACSSTSHREKSAEDINEYSFFTIDMNKDNFEKTNYPDDIFSEYGVWVRGVEDLGSVLTRKYRESGEKYFLRTSVKSKNLRAVMRESRYGDWDKMIDVVGFPDDMCSEYSIKYKGNVILKAGFPTYDTLYPLLANISLKEKFYSDEYFKPLSEEAKKGNYVRMSPYMPKDSDPIPYFRIYAYNLGYYDRNSYGYDSQYKNSNRISYGAVHLFDNLLVCSYSPEFRDLSYLTTKIYNIERNSIIKKYFPEEKYDIKPVDELELLDRVAYNAPKQGEFESREKYTEREKISRESVEKENSEIDLKNNKLKSDHAIAIAIAKLKSEIEKRKEDIGSYFSKNNARLFELSVREALYINYQYPDFKTNYNPNTGDFKIGVRRHFIPEKQGYEKVFTRNNMSLEKAKSFSEKINSGVNPTIRIKVAVKENSVSGDEVSLYVRIVSENFKELDEIDTFLTDNI
ncbi:MAG: hypothetical protein HWE24_18080 [Oceanospirillaceae bacterium]|nr:hypothetical protein [Oceanospirillaceae bacterium]